MIAASRMIEDADEGIRSQKLTFCASHIYIACYISGWRWKKATLIPSTELQHFPSPHYRWLIIHSFTTPPPLPPFIRLYNLLSSYSLVSFPPACYHAPVHMKPLVTSNQLKPLLYHLSPEHLSHLLAIT